MIRVLLISREKEDAHLGERAKRTTYQLVDCPANPAEHRQTVPSCWEPRCSKGYIWECVCFGFRDSDLASQRVLCSLEGLE